MSLYIITGLGRCGTSILTKFLGSVGFGLGKNVHWHDEARAGLELSPAYSLNVDMYNKFCKQGIPIDIDDEPFGDYWKGHTFRSAINSIDKDERQGKVDIVKDPRFTWDGGLIAAWWEARKDIKLIICHRLVSSIYNSRKNLPEKWDDPKRSRIEQYYEDFGKFMDMVLYKNIPHTIFHYPSFLMDFEALYEILNYRIGLIFPLEKGALMWDALIDHDLLKD
jgi:hypothetical protein